MQKSDELVQLLLEELKRQTEASDRREQILLDALSNLNLSGATSASPGGSNSKMSSDFHDVSSQIDKFAYNPEELSTFDRWIRRAETVFASDKAQNISDTDKAAIIRSKLSTNEYYQFESHILPKKPQELELNDTIKQLSMLFGRKESLFSRRFRAWQTEIKPEESYLALAARIKKVGEDFEIT